MFRRAWLSSTSRLLAAAAFAAVTLLATVVWMSAVTRSMLVTVELGFDTSFDAATRTRRIDSVRSASPAEKAGLREGDRLVAVDGRPLADERAMEVAWSRHKPGDAVQLVVLRPGDTTPIVANARFRAAASATSSPYLERLVRDLHPLPFVLVGLAVLFLRTDDGNAWLLAILFSCFVATPGLPAGSASLAPPLRAFLLAHVSISLGLIGPLFYFFFAVFPARSPFDRRWPWLKWAAVAVGLCFVPPGMAYGGLRLPQSVAAVTGQALSSQIPVLFVLGCFGLGLASLVASYWADAGGDVRRKLRVILWGTLVSVLPALAQVGIQAFTAYRAPMPVGVAVALLGFVLPASFAYAVVKHRVLEIPVLLRRSARYLFVQRGFTLLLSVVSIGLTLLFSSWFTQHLPTDEQSTAVSLGAVFGTAMLWSGLQVHRRVSGRIDRAFFRSAYDARVILEDLAAQSGTAPDRETLARLLEHHLLTALHPASLVVYLLDSDGMLRAAAGSAPPGLGVLGVDDHLSRLLDRGRPLETPFAEALPRSLALLDPECLVPIVKRDRGLAGLLVLGRRLSEESYSGEDRRLLASVAGQAGVALENMALAEDIARRIESERRTAREMEIARDVQARLLPAAAPPLATLDCAARCVQARAVGGDCYDFLDLGAGRVGFVVADVSGKGIHAALLMANLQAHLRSLSSVAPGDPVRVLCEANRLLFRSTATQHYATVFFGVYEDDTRRLCYVNGGHNPPVLLRHDVSDPIRLAPTAPVVGLFDEWQGRTGEVTIEAEDVLAIFSDGVTEAMRGDAEFGEARFLEELRALRSAPARTVVEHILAAVQQFSGGTQSDDLTLLVLRGVAPIAEG